MKKIFLILLLCYAKFNFADENINGLYRGYLYQTLDDVDFSMKTVMYLNALPGQIITGEMQVTLDYDNKKYYAKFRLSGAYNNTDGYDIYLKAEYLIHKDFLPDGVDWCLGEGYLTLYRNTKEQRLALDGQWILDCHDQHAELELILNKYEQDEEFNMKSLY